MTKETVLQGCTIKGTTVYLPTGQLDRSLYQEVAKALQLIGGKWKGGSVQGFIFPHDPTALLAQISNGTKRNLQKEYQFFETPALLADRMVSIADIQEYDLVLEPSAGQGALIKAVHKQHTVLVHYCELMEINRTFLTRLPNTAFLKDNFLLLNTPTLFHKIIANPPFSKNQDIAHIMHMWRCLMPGGRLVTIASKHWQYATGKKETAFRAFLEDQNAEIEDIPAGEFKESGTTIATALITLDKN